MRCVLVVAQGVRALELASVLDAVDALNSIIKPQGWSLDVVSAHGGPCHTACGHISVATRVATDAGPVDLAIVLGGNDAAIGHPAHIALIQRLVLSGATVCLLSEAAAVLARRGVLAEQPVCLPWDHPSVLEGGTFDARCDDGIYRRSGRIVTSSGAASTLDLVLALVADELGGRVAMRLADVLKSAPARPGSASQRCSLNEKYQTSNTVLLQALALMEDHVEHPLSIKDIAASVARSSRQLERLFQKHYGLTPKRFYEGIRVRRAHWMVAHSDFPLGEIALMSGFASQTTFAKAFARYFGTSASAMRRQSRPSRAKATG